MASRRLSTRFENPFFGSDLLQQVVDLRQIGRVLQTNFQIGQLVHQIDVAGQKLVQRRIDQPENDRQTVHGPKDSGKVFPLIGQQGIEGFFLVQVPIGCDHLLDDGQAIGLEKHVFGAAQADALGTVVTGAFGVTGIVGVGPDAQATKSVGP